VGLGTLRLEDLVAVGRGHLRTEAALLPEYPSPVSYVGHPIGEHNPSTPAVSFAQIPLIHRRLGERVKSTEVV